MKHAASYFLPAILLVALIACSDPTADPVIGKDLLDDPVIDEGLLGVVWKADSLLIPDGMFVLLSHEQMTIQFTEDFEVLGRTICTLRYDGVYMISALGAIRIDSLSLELITLSCIGRLGIIEAGFIQALKNNITAYQVSDNRLDLYDSDHQYVLWFSIE